MMLNAGVEFKRIRVRNIVGAIPLIEKRTPMLIGNGVFHITGKITLTGQIPIGSAARVRFINEKQTPSQVPSNASFLVNTLRRGRRELNVDFTIPLDRVNGRSLFFQGEMKRNARDVSQVPCRFDGHIDQIG